MRPPRRHNVYRRVFVMQTNHTYIFWGSNPSQQDDVTGDVSWPTDDTYGIMEWAEIEFMVFMDSSFRGEFVERRRLTMGISHRRRYHACRG